jgi:hypothetical protein
LSRTCRRKPFSTGDRYSSMNFLQLPVAQCATSLPPYLARKFRQHYVTSAGLTLTIRERAFEEVIVASSKEFPVLSPEGFRNIRKPTLKPL